MQRRTILKVTIAIVNTLMAGVLAIPAIRYLFAPLWRSREEPTFIRVTPLSALPVERPVRAVVTADRWDTYTHYPPGPIGVVWLFRKAGGGEDPSIRCLQTICPHLGCAIDYAADRGVFSCPCHASDFDLNARRRFGPSPRDMDELECRVTEPDEQGRRWIEVKYQEFQTGIPNKVQIGV